MKEKSDSGSRKRFSEKVKKDIIAKHENSCFCHRYRIQYTKSTISTIVIKNLDALKAVQEANMISKQRLKLLDEFEKRLLIWINE